MIGHERPGQTQAAGLCQPGTQAAQEVGSVDIRSKDGSALNTAHHHVVEMTRKIDARLARRIS